MSIGRKIHFNYFRPTFCPGIKPDLKLAFITYTCIIITATWVIKFAHYKSYNILLSDLGALESSLFNE